MNTRLTAPHNTTVYHLSEINANYQDPTWWQHTTNYGGKYGITRESMK